MKSLQAFWHWVDNERPIEVLEKHIEPLTDNELRALWIARDLVVERLDLDFTEFDSSGMSDLDALNALREHWPAIRDLSMVICAGIEVMCEDVPEGSFTEQMLDQLYPPERVAAEDAMAERMTSTLQRQGMIAPGDGLDPIYRREYLGDWIIPKDEHGTDTFRGVERTPPEKLQGGMPKWYRGIDLSADASEGLKRAQMRMQLQANMAEQDPTRFLRATMQASPLLAPLNEVNEAQKHRAEMRRAAGVCDECGAGPIHRPYCSRLP